MSAPIQYLSAVRRVLDYLEQTQIESIEQAAEIIAGAISGGGMVWCAAIGHSNEQDFLNRAGGLAAVQHFRWSFSASSPVPECKSGRPRPEPYEEDLETIRHAVRASNLRSGDVLLVGSVSGKNRAPVELALACREAGAKVVAFTSLEYTAQVDSLHPSGKKLCEVADVVIDNGAPYGDAAVSLEGYPCDVLPVSGASMVIAGWMLWGSVMEKLAAKGTPATVFMSVNREGGSEFYQKAVAQYNERGF